MDGKPTFCRHTILSSLSKICNHLGEITAWSWNSLMIIAYLLRFLQKKTPYGHIFTNLFRKNSPRRRTTSCVQISWNLADWKSAKSCVIYLTKKQDDLQWQKEPHPFSPIFTSLILLKIFTSSALDFFALVSSSSIFSNNCGCLNARWFLMTLVLPVVIVNVINIR